MIQKKHIFPLLFSEENKVPRTLFEARKSQRETKKVWDCVFLPCVYSVENEDSLLFGLIRHKKQNKQL